MTRTELAEAGELLAQLTANLYEERAPGVAFWAFYLDDRETELEADEVLQRFHAGRGVYAIEVVWDEDLELQQRGEGRVVRTLGDLRALQQRVLALQDGVERVTRNLLAASPPSPPAATSRPPTSWLAARAGPKR